MQQDSSRLQSFALFFKGDDKKEVIERPKRFESSHCLGAWGITSAWLETSELNSPWKKAETRPCLLQGRAGAARAARASTFSWKSAPRRPPRQVATLNGTMSEFKAGCKRCNRCSQLAPGGRHLERCSPCMAGQEGQGTSGVLLHDSSMSGGVLKFGRESTAVEAVTW